MRHHVIATRRRSVGLERSVVAACEPLERRALLSLSAAGPELRANVFTTDHQDSQAIALDADGDFVVVWASPNQEGAGGTGTGVFARRFNAGGTPQGGEVLVNTVTFGNQTNPAVTMDADGDFVVVWVSADGPLTRGVFGQRFSAAGAKQGAEFHVNTSTASNATFPAVAAAAGGAFVVAWQQQDGASEGIYARRFDAAGVPLGVVRANAYTTGPQTGATVAIDASGDFVVAWAGEGTGDINGVHAQRFDGTGAAQGAAFRVNTLTPGSQGLPAVAMDASGDFAVSWGSASQDGSLYGVYAQRYSAAGTAQGAEFRVNSFTTGTQWMPAIAMDHDGDFLVAWQSINQDGSGFGIYAQQFSAAGAPQGPEFRVNTFTTGSQEAPAVAIDADGNAAVAWTSAGQDGSFNGVYLQRYDQSDPDAAPPVIGGVFVGGNRVTPYSTHASPLSQIVVSFSENMSDAGGATGPNSVTNPANWLVTRDGANVTPAITYGFNPGTNRYEALLNLPQSFTDGNFQVKARDNLRDIAGHRLDGNLDGVSGSALLLPFSIVGIDARGGEFQVNTFTTNNQGFPSVAMDAERDFVVVWRGSGSGDADGVFAQRYNAAGAAEGGEFRVNTFTTNLQASPSVAMSPQGDFVVAWNSALQDGSANGVYAQRFNAAGLAQGGEFRVNTFTTNDQVSPSVAMDSTGDFVVAWNSYAQDGNAHGVYAQRYDAAGAAQGGEFRVNTFTADSQDASSVAMSPQGDFVVVWTSEFQDGSGGGVYAHRFNAAGAAQGGEFQVNTFTTTSQYSPSLAMDATGDFVVAWNSSVQDGSANGVYAQRFNAAGVAQGGEFRVNTFTTDHQVTPSVAMDATGDFVVAWNSYGQDGSEVGVYAQRYDAAGVARGGEFRVNASTTGPQRFPSVEIGAAGELVVAWEGRGPGDIAGVFARRYGLRDTPHVGLLADTPDPVSAGNSFTLSASEVSSDDGVVTSVSFYRESNGEPGLQVGVEGDTLVGTASSEVGGFWSANVSTVGLADGTYTYWAQATDDAALTGPPASTTNTVIGAAPPAVNASSFNFATLPQRLSFTFNQNVSASLGLDDIDVQQFPGGATVTPDALSYNAATNTATFTFNSAIPDGRYRARLIASGITGPGGNLPADHTFEFTFLRGDANGDGRVNLNDFNILAANFGQAPRDFTQGDFDYSGTVNLNDFNILASRFGASVSPDAFGWQSVDTTDTDDVRELIDELT